jgi:hypothetical protein
MAEKPATFGARWPGHMKSALSTYKGLCLAKGTRGCRPYLGNVGLIGHRRFDAIPR